MPLIEALKEYIAFLETEMSKSAAYLDVHGFETPPEIVAKGEELRAKIKKLSVSNQ